MQSITKNIQDLSDSEVVEVTKELFNIVYTQVPYDEVLHNSEGITAVRDLRINKLPSILEKQLVTPTLNYGN